jgi:hypothetical protein
MDLKCSDGKPKNTPSLKVIRGARSHTVGMHSIFENLRLALETPLNDLSPRVIWVSFVLSKYMSSFADMSRTMRPLQSIYLMK